MSVRTFCDLETTGLDYLVNQCVEVALVRVVDGVVAGNKALHFYVDHPQLTYDLDALKRFGERTAQRKPGIDIHHVSHAGNHIRNWMVSNGCGKHTLCGKNVGRFDSYFLKQLFPDLYSFANYRHGEIAEKYEHRDDFQPPDLEACRLRALKMGISGDMIRQPVTHTALEDALLCAELYAGWYNSPEWIVPQEDRS